MRQAWSLFWLVVASCIAASIIASMIQPYLGVIVVMISIVLVAVIGFKAYRFVRTGRRSY